MDNPIMTHLSPVYTADEALLGQAICLYRQPDTTQINPDLRLYATYLQVANNALGESFFIPTDFVATAESSRIQLSLSMKEIEQETFSRRPMFVAMGRTKREALAY